MQEHLYRHLSSPGHTGFLNDGSVISIGETDESDPKKWENQWMKTFETMVTTIVIPTPSHSYNCYKRSSLWI